MILYSRMHSLKLANLYSYGQMAIYPQWLITIVLDCCYIYYFNFIMQPNPEVSSDKQPLTIKADGPSLYMSHHNSSTSRRQYSIPKGVRFVEQSKANNNSQFYNLPSTQSNRSASFGFGSKMDLSKMGNQAPSPDSYSIAGQFQKHHNKGIKMGLGRELIRAISVFDEKPFKIPGPGTYETIEPQSQKRISLSGRVTDLSEKWKHSIPGPGAYKTLQLLDNNLKSNISKFESVKSGKFSKGQVRNQYEQMRKKQDYPSPAKYNGLQHYEVIDHFPRHKGLSFSRIARQPIALPTVAPGPGAYNSISDFRL